MTESDNLTICQLRSLHELDEAVKLQQIYWGTEPDSVIPAHMLFSLVTNGGHVLAAMDGDICAGVLIGFIGLDIHNNKKSTVPHIYSKRMVVRPEYRHYGLGTRLKFAQREVALELGIQKVAWTFDPLLARNAHLNIRKLGGISRSFRENYYGTDNSGGLSPLGFSDRLYVEWLLSHERVETRAQGIPEQRTLVDYFETGAVIVNPTIMNEAGLLLPSGSVMNVDGEPVLVEIPFEFVALMNMNEPLAVQWRIHNRSTVEDYIHKGYAVVDVVRGDYDGRERIFYLLSKEQFD